MTLQDLGKNLKSKKPCPQTGAACTGTCIDQTIESKEMYRFGNWYRPVSLDQVTSLLCSFNDYVKYRLVAGNTGTGPLSSHMKALTTFLLYLCLNYKCVNTSIV